MTNSEKKPRNMRTKIEIINEPLVEPADYAQFVTYLKKAKWGCSSCRTLARALVNVACSVAHLACETDEEWYSAIDDAQNALKKPGVQVINQGDSEVKVINPGVGPGLGGNVDE